MKHFFTLLRNELWKLLISPSSYIAGFLFLLIMGFMFQWLLNLYTSGPQEEHPSNTFFRLFFVPVFFMVPLLTMRSLSEEKSSGTIETLMTSPVTVSEIILSKFAASYIYYLILWLLTAGFHLLFFAFAHEDSALDPYPIIGGYLYIAISGSLFLSLGIFASSLTRSQLVAGILSFTLIFAFIIVGSSISELAVVLDPQPEWLSLLSRHLDAIEHMADFSAGVIDTRAFVLYLSCAAAFLFISILRMVYKKDSI